MNKEFYKIAALCDPKNCRLKERCDKYIDNITVDIKTGTWLEDIGVYDAPLDCSYFSELQGDDDGV